MRMDTENGTPRTYSDLISVLLESARLRAAVTAHRRPGGDWQLRDSAASPTFHLVVRGSCWLRVPRMRPEELGAGDLAVLLRGDSHWLSAAARARGTETRLPRARAGKRATELISGRFDFGDALVGEILDDLPDVLVVRGETMHLEGLARLLAAEAAGAAPGRKVAMDRLSDLLFIALLRHLMERGVITRGLLAALGDARLSRALAAMHGEPARRWTLQSLARAAGMSRTAFAQRFRRLMGTTPLRWLTRLRMDKAQTILAMGRRPVGSVAAEVGYDSEPAFRRAYARWRRMRVAAAPAARAKPRARVRRRA